jgi:hypothetical protein
MDDRCICPHNLQNRIRIICRIEPGPPGWDASTREKSRSNSYSEPLQYYNIRRGREPTVEMLVGVSDGQAAEVAEGLATLALHLVAALLFVESWNNSSNT